MDIDRETVYTNTQVGQSYCSFVLTRYYGTDELTLLVCPHQDNLIGHFGGCGHKVSLQCILTINSVGLQV